MKKPGERGTGMEGLEHICCIFHWKPIRHGGQRIKKEDKKIIQMGYKDPCVPNVAFGCSHMKERWPRCLVDSFF